MWFDENDHSQGFFWFRGGAVLIIDPTEDKERICYSIIKNSGSDWRLKQQRQFMATDVSKPRDGNPTAFQRFFSQFVAYADRPYYFSQFT